MRSLVLAVALCLMVSPARASEPIEHVVRKIACMQAMSGERYEQSEAFRKKIAGRLTETEYRIEKRLSEQADRFFQTLDSDTQTRATGPSVLMQRLGLETRSFKRPALNRVTRELLNLAYSSATYRDLKSAEEIALRRGNLILAAKSAVEADPFFVWLKDYGLASRDKRLADESVRGRSDEAAKIEVDPVTLLFANLERSGIMYLPPDLSLMRIYRDLDPLLSTELIRISTDALQDHAKLMVIRHRLKDDFDQRNSSAGFAKAWALSADLADAKRNFQPLIDTLRGYSRFISEESFLKLQSLSPTDISDSRQIEIFKLMTNLSGFDEKRLRWLREEAIASVRSYPRFLLTAFGGEHTRPVYETLLALARIIEIGIVSEDEAVLDQYLTKKAKGVEGLQY